MGLVYHVCINNLLIQIYLQVSRERRKGGGTLGLSINSVAAIEPEHVPKNLVPLHFGLCIKIHPRVSQQPIRMLST